MSADSGKWFVIVNPVAGGGRGLDHFPQISKHLRDAHIRCEPVFTEHKFHATELTVTAVREGADDVYADAKAINDRRAAEAEPEVIEDTASDAE